MKLKSIILSALLFLLFISPVQAHTKLISVDPASETAMLTYPAEIKLTFGEAIIADATFASITSESG